jgi:hypothetical protein
MNPTTTTGTEADKESEMRRSTRDQTHENIQIREDLINDPNTISGGFSMMAKALSGENAKAAKTEEEASFVRLLELNASNQFVYSFRQIH